MKDEEMAEVFVNEKCKDCYMCSYSEHKNPYKICQRRKDRKQAFLAGLKAGRPQWHKPEEPEEQKIKLEKVDDKTAYEKLLIKYAELEADNRLLEQRGSDILKELLDKNKRCKELERQIEKMKCCQNCEHHFYNGLHYICCDLHEPKSEPITDIRCCLNWKLEE